MQAFKLFVGIVMLLVAFVLWLMIIHEMWDDQKLDVVYVGITILYTAGSVMLTLSALHVI